MKASSIFTPCFIALFATVCLTGAAFGQPPTGAPPTQVEAPPQMSAEEIAQMTQKASYLIGRNMGENFKSMGIQIDAQALMQGIADVNGGKESALTEAQAQEIMMAFDRYARGREQAMFAEQADANQREGEAFLAANKNKEGVVQTESGLQYKVLVAGSGAQPANTDVVKVKYTGKFIDGTQFDSSGDDTASFPVNGVVKGFSEGLQRMNVGSKFMFFIPANLAYGMGGGRMEPNKTLIFEVELVEIVK